MPWRAAKLATRSGSLAATARIAVSSYRALGPTIVRSAMAVAPIRPMSSGMTGEPWSHPRGRHGGHHPVTPQQRILGRTIRQAVQTTVPVRQGATAQYEYTGPGPAEIEQLCLPQ